MGYKGDHLHSGEECWDGELVLLDLMLKLVQRNGDYPRNPGEGELLGLMSKRICPGKSKEILRVWV